MHTNKHESKGQKETDWLKLNRRRFLARAGLVTAAVTSELLPAQSVEAAARPLSITGLLIDTNVWLSRWPFRRLPVDETAALVTKLRKTGVTQAWAGSFDGMLHKDLGSVNARLAQECRSHGGGVLLPFGTINPRLPDWEEELRRCHEEHKMPGIRLHPNYHGYKLEDPIFAKLLDLAVQHGLIVQVAASMEDERTQHPLVQVPHVDTAPLSDLLKTRPALKIVLLNWNRAVKSDQVVRLAKAGQASFDISTVEGVNGVANLLQQVPVDRVLFGSYSPFFYLESALLKLKESELSSEQLVAVKAANARHVLGTARG